MTDNQENKPKKLTLSGSKLSIAKPLSLSKDLLTSKSKTIVAVKKSTLPNTNPSLHIDNSGESSSAEFTRRLMILKNAAQQAKHSDPRVSTLTRIASMNQKAPDDSSESDGGDVAQTSNDAEITSAESGRNNTSVGAFSRSELPRSSFSTAQDDVTEKGKLSDGKASTPRAKVEEVRKLKKADIFSMLNEGEGSVFDKTRSLASIKRAREKEKRKAASQQPPEKIYREIILPESIGVGDLANKMSERVADVIKELMKLGILANNNQVIDADTAELVATTLGHTVKRVQESDIENILINEEDAPESLTPRAPVVTIMGHVDHGKTSLLDALKSTNVAGGEAGGITQHIGAYRVTLADNRAITFLDTPGHEAFSEMRSRGAQITDIVVIVVAADDGIKAQTVEAINHAKAANVPIIVAINKIDKPDVNLDKIKNELLLHELVGEEFGGDTMIIQVSALNKINLDKLEEAILLVAEMQDLKANATGPASGAVIEARVGKAGIAATILVQRGTLKNGDIIVAGRAYGKIKRINDDRGEDIAQALPSMPVQVYGLMEVPHAGGKFHVVQTEKQARDIASYRDRLAKEKKIFVSHKASLEDLFLKATGKGLEKTLPIIIRGDVHGSVEAIITSLMKLPSDEVRLNILHSAVGAITESDVMLAKASGAIIMGFNVRANSKASLLASKENIDIRYYGIIYNLLDGVKAIMSGMLSPIIREQYIGSAEIRQIFNVTKVGKIAGCYVTKGVIRKGAGVRLLRDNVVIHEGKLKTLKRFKEEVKEVKENFECGIAFENYDDIKENDAIEVFELVEEAKKLEIS